MESLEQHYASTCESRWVPGFNGKKNFPPGKLRALAKHLGRVHQDVAETWCVCVFLPRKKKRGCFFGLITQKTVEHSVQHNVHVVVFCWGKTQQTNCKGCFFLGLEIWECTHWMNPTGFFNKIWRSNFVKSIWSHHVPWWFAGFPWKARTLVAETRQACIKIHANETIMTFQVIWFPETGLTGSPKKFKCHLFWKTKKMSEKPMTSNQLDIFGYDIYLLFRYIISLKQTQF